MSNYQRDNKKPEYDKEYVRQNLEKAFADVPNPTDTRSMPPLISDRAILIDSDAELRTNLILFTTEDFQFILPEVLTNLLDTDNRDGIHSVIYMLNVLSYEPEERLAQTERLFGKDFAEQVCLNNITSREAKLQRFANFTPQQAAAVRDWLLVAQTWQELEKDKWEVDAAFQYWNKRASS